MASVPSSFATRYISSQTLSTNPDQPKSNEQPHGIHHRMYRLAGEALFRLFCIRVGYVLSRVFKTKTRKRTGTLHSLDIYLFGNYIDVFNVFGAEYALFRPIGLPPINYSNSIMIGALHIFHLVMYSKDITRDDLFHHLLFVTFNQCAQFYPILSGWKVYQWGSALNAINFFACGLPGGLDYFFLGLTKIGKMQRLTHKRLQAVINVWLRCPGIFSSVKYIFV